MFKNKLILGMIGLSMLSASSFSFSQERKITGINKVDDEITTLNDIDYSKYSNFSEMIDDVSKNEKLKNKNLISDEDMLILSRVGLVSEKTDVREDVEKFIKSNNDFSLKEKKLMMNFSSALQEMMMLNNIELLKENNIIYLNVNLLSKVMGIIKENDNVSKERELYSFLKQVEIKTLNTKERKDQYNLFQDITKTYASINDEFVPRIFVAAYKKCFDKKPTEKDLKQMFLSLSEITEISKEID